MEIEQNTIFSDWAGWFVALGFKEHFWGKVAKAAHSGLSSLLACERWPQLHGEAGNWLGVEEQWCPSEAPGLQSWAGTALFLPLARAVLPAG